MSSSGWEETSWGEIATLEYGKALRSYKDSQCDIPVYGTNGQIGFTNQALCDSEGVIIGRKGAYRGVHYSAVPFYAIDTAFYLKQKKHGIFYAKWAYYQLLTQNINSMDSGSAIPSTSRPDFYALRVDIPSLLEQRAIAATLSCLDDKIELNNRINKTLEEMAQAIFKSWFVDFEPFQDGEFENSELGRIPKGWRVVKLKEISSFQNGYAFYKVGYSDNGVMVIDLGNVDLLGNFVRTKADKFISNELYKKEKMEKFHVCKDDLVMIMTDRKATMDLLGKVAKISTDERYILNQRVGRIRVNENINVNFLYTYLNNEFLLNELKKKALGSVQKYVNTSDITDLKLIIPDNIVMHKFGNIINPFFKEMELLKRENEAMNAIRDSLLPKLMSGEIRVPVEEGATNEK